MVAIEYYYAVISGFAYLGEAELRRLADAAGARIRYRPVDIGKVFAAAGATPPATQSAARRAWRDAELARWSAVRGVPITIRPAHWPTNGALASRLVLAAQEAGLDAGRLSSAFLRAVWAEDRDIAERSTCADIVTATLREAAATLMAAADSDDVHAAFTAATDAAIAIGVFGSPTYIVDGEVFFGQDRLEFIATKLGVTS